VVRAVALDLDDTLWPFGPVARRIQAALEGWLAEHAPATAAMFDRVAAQQAVEDVRRDRADLAHDMGAVRREALRTMLAAAGDDPALVEDAFAVVFEARQQVELHPDAAPALDRLAGRLPLVAVTNGNADLRRTGVDRWFAGGVVSVMEHGAAKPDPAIFHAACARLGLPPAEVLHAGDDLLRDVHGALGAGLQAAWVHRDLDGEAPPEALPVRDLLALADAVGC
jgi:FMN hydrolase / 5-amino-6-(5-phospho-D-ribitylamino)uracil phosphatase